MKQQFTVKHQALHGKPREIDLLFGKLVAASQLTDAELRRALASALSRLAQQGMQIEEAN